MDNCFLCQEITFLEACIENHTKSNLYMDQVEFEPSQNWSATMLKADGPHSDYNAQSRYVRIKYTGYFESKICSVFRFIIKYFLIQFSCTFVIYKI